MSGEIAGGWGGLVQNGKTADPRKTFGAAVTAAARKNPAIVALSADSGGSSGLGDFKKEFPDRYYEFGIMEQGVVGIAAGLAATGKIPVFCAIAPFVTSRPFEMFRNDLGYMRQNVKIVGRNGGISYSDLGSTHHSLEDFAIIRMIPGVTILAPEDPGEIEGAVEAMLALKGPVYTRIGNDPIPELFERRPFQIGKGRVVRPGKDVTVVVTGAMAGNVLGAAEILAARGVDAEVLAMPTVWPLDGALILESRAKTGRVVTVEEHYVTGGLGTMVQELTAENNPAPVKKLGIPHGYASSGPYKELLAYYGLDGESIAASIADFVRAFP
ncbi:MAG: transketolase family protein [Treponema sp.]|jgi:transketolase|nr:transketolase family protein [Treponema sp.]